MKTVKIVCTVVNYLVVEQSADASEMFFQKRPGIVNIRYQCMFIPQLFSFMKS